MAEAIFLSENTDTDSLQSSNSSSAGQKNEVEISTFMENESPYSSNNPFADPDVSERYREVYESSQYESRHRFDPNFKWTKEAEKKVYRKVDFRVTMVACCLFVAMQLDRTNLPQAVSDNMLQDLHMTTNDYNIANTIFYACRVISTLPSQYFSRKFGFHRWVPFQVISWSIVTVCQFKLSGKASLFVCRILLGFLEGGFLLDIFLWLSLFYVDKELTFRISILYVMTYLTVIFNYLLAYGILHMRGVLGYAGWRWLFLVEGLITLVIGLASIFLLRPSACETSTPWNPKGWFSEEEEKIVINKTLREDPNKGDMNNRQSLNLKNVWVAICDVNIWPLYLICIMAFLPDDILGSYLTLLLKSMHFNVFHTNLLCIPYNFIKIFTLLGVSYLSEYLNDILGVSLILPLWAGIGLGVLRYWSGTMVNKWGTYAVLIFTMGNPFIDPMLISACSKNSFSVNNRIVNTAIYSSFLQAGAIIASNLYRQDDAPLYIRGNTVLFYVMVALIPVILFTKLYYWHMNKKRSQVWGSMTKEEQTDYLETTTDTGSKRLDFKFSH